MWWMEGCIHEVDGGVYPCGGWRGVSMRWMEGYIHVVDGGLYPCGGWKAVSMTEASRMKSLSLQTWVCTVLSM